MDVTMTDNEIIKALQCCSNAKNEGDCVILGCPYYLEEQCTKKNGNDALSLINRQKAEIEWLSEAIHQGNITTAVQMRAEENYQWRQLERMKRDKAEAIKEFAERFKELCGKNTDSAIVWAKTTIDNLVKEMVGDCNV